MTDLARVGGLAGVDVGDLVVLEKGWDVLSCVVGSRSGGGIREDSNLNGDRTNDRFLSLALFFILALFFLSASSSSSGASSTSTFLKRTTSIVAKRI